MDMEISEFKISIEGIIKDKRCIQGKTDFVYNVIQKWYMG